MYKVVYILVLIISTHRQKCQMLLDAPAETWINVKTVYGAKGDGITDDTKALQKAVDQFADRTFQLRVDGENNDNLPQKGTTIFEKDRTGNRTKVQLEEKYANYANAMADLKKPMDEIRTMSKSYDGDFYRVSFYSLSKGIEIVE